MNKEKPILDGEDHHPPSTSPFRNPAFLFSLGCLVGLAVFIFKSMLNGIDPFENFFKESFQLSSLGFASFTLLLLGLISGFIGVLTSKGKQWPVFVAFLLNLFFFLYFLWKAALA